MCRGSRVRIHQILFIVMALFSLKSLAGNPGQPATGITGTTDRIAPCHLDSSGSTCPKQIPRVNPTPQSAQQNNDSQPSSAEQSCQNLRNQMAVCYQQSQEAVMGCKEEKDSDLQAVLREVRDKTAMADQVLTNTGINGACGVILKSTSTVASAFLAFQQSCNEKRNRCISTCTQIKEQSDSMGCDRLDNFGSIVNLSGSLNDCNNLKVVVDQGNQFAQDLPGLAQQAAACQSAMNGQPIPEICATNPTAIVCQQAGNTGSCNDPSQATSVVCACRNGPNTTACQMAMSNSQKLNSQGSSMTAASNSRLQNAATGGKAGSGAPDFGDLASEMAAGSFKAQPSEEIGGRMGGSANVGGGGGAGGSGGADSAADSAGGISTNVNGGFGRGGGGGGGAWNGGGNAGGAGKYAGGVGIEGNGFPNLNKFRPQMNYQGSPRRDLAGVVGSDGMLGPHANLWQTIKNRYNYEWRQGTLKP